MMSGAVPRPGVASEVSGEGAYLVPLHTRLAGRARFKSRALYRAEARKAAVETRLRTVTGVQNVVVNTLTGTLLVEFAPNLSVTELQPALEAALAEVPLPPVRRPGASLDFRQRN